MNLLIILIILLKVKKLNINNYQVTLKASSLGRFSFIPAKGGDTNATWNVWAWLG